jgi:hypothetical protein
LPAHVVHEHLRAVDQRLVGVPVDLEAERRGVQPANDGPYQPSA